MLKILIISENRERADRVLRQIYLREENPTISPRVNHQIIAENAIYKAVAAEPEKLKGIYADQIILDYVYVNKLKEVAQSILAKSCVPEQFQIIDDRQVLL